MTSLPLADLVATSAAVAATRSRKDKTAAIASLVQTADPSESALAVSLLAGDPRQGRIGVGWATVGRLDVDHATEATLTIADVDHVLSAVDDARGQGSTAARDNLLHDLLTRATAAEADFLRRLLLGELRQGANEGLVVEGLAKAAGVKAAIVRRALMLSGDLGLVASAAMQGGTDALESIELRIFRPLRPMLASTASDVADAMAALGEASVEWKLDGVRIQVHRRGDEVRMWTRNLNEISDRLPDVAARVRAMPAHTLVLDGEVLGVADDDAPQAFQDTMSSFGAEHRAERSLVPWFFDLLHRDGVDLVDAPVRRRRRELVDVAGDAAIPGALTESVDEAQEVLDAALAAGHEGVVVKGADAPYEAGRRGKSWRKVKPVHTLDLVVLGAEWGHGRRQGWLSNLHLGARDPAGGFVMVGKTFKGMTDELLQWQTEELLRRKTDERGITVFVEPTLVVEIAIDGVQVSTRYPGGAALRFARVKQYRADKEAGDADTIDTVRAML